ncbi:glycosyltransferase [Neptunitalea lumnitzerae]|uniref:Glycosyl transferase family 1 n=1 Tax=Neptunitalea lumnitzerae TaxID=2965509 RepID=A0ABQ5ML30_9FLAO|nr:glycosyltransferase [Neptunitalea sp. Y10]GLB50006.1 glycosyl transferase family 1 [Neptunitalea sp. Y10]
MKILLLGEYSGFFNSLKAGLTSIGHDVTLAGAKDGFKNYDVDFSFEPKFTSKGIGLFIRKAIHKVSKYDIGIWESYYIFKKHKELFSNYDVVFLINEQPITQNCAVDKRILKHIFTHNKKVFLSACGDDYTYISYLFENKLPYHILTPYFNNHNLKKYYPYSLHYITKASKKLYEYVFKNVQGIIPGDYDYVLAYEGTPKALPLIPFPVRTHLLAYQEPVIENKIIIFHGINKVNYYKKGNEYFEKALAIVAQKYPDKVSIITAVSLPYKEYMTKYNSCHILLDQALAYDQGYNALEAMARGKVVFTGASPQWLQHYNLQEDTVAIHAVPDENIIAEKLEWLILNPNKILEISKNAKAFIEKEHNYKAVAKEYVKQWSN